MSVHAVSTTFAVLAVIGQWLAGLLVLLFLLYLIGVKGPFDALRRLVWGYELWLAFLVAALATAGSLYFSEIAHFVPCRLCWFQRIGMYPLSVTLLLAALWNDRRAVRYLLPLPVIGLGVSIYHILVENQVIKEAQACLLSAPGGCTTKWINVFGYLTIPTLAATAFALIIAFFLFTIFEPTSSAGDDFDENPDSAAPPDGDKSQLSETERTANG